MRILVIDDIAPIRHSLTLLLNLIGHDTHSAPDGEVGRARLQGDGFDVVIADIIMPGGGLWRIRQLRREFPDLNIIAMTGSDELIGPALSAGATHALLKPFKWQALQCALLEGFPARSGLPYSRGETLRFGLAHSGIS